MGMKAIWGTSWMVEEKNLNVINEIMRIISDSDFVFSDLSSLLSDLKVVINLCKGETKITDSVYWKEYLENASKTE